MNKKLKIFGFVFLFIALALTLSLNSNALLNNDNEDINLEDLKINSYPTDTIQYEEQYNTTKYNNETGENETITKTRLKNTDIIKINDYDIEEIDNEVYKLNLNIKRSEIGDKLVGNIDYSDVANELNDEGYTFNNSNFTPEIVEELEEELNDLSFQVLNGEEIEDERNIPKGLAKSPSKDEYKITIVTKPNFNNNYKHASFKIGSHSSVIDLVSSDLVSYYELEENSDDVIDSHGDNDGTNNGADRGVTGKIGNAFDFDGSDDYVEVTDMDNSIFGENDWSVSVWAKPTDTSYNSILSVEDPNNDGDSDKWIDVRVDRDNIEAGFDDGSDKKRIQGDIAINSDEWIHIVVVHTEGEGYELFVDDNSDGTKTDNGEVTDSGQSLYLGNDGKNEKYFDGLIDEVGIWDRALSSSEVSDLYNNGDGLQYESESYLDLEDDFNDSIDYAENYTYQIDYNSSSNISYFNSNNSKISVNDTGYLYYNDYLDAGNHKINITAENEDDDKDNLIIDLEVNKIPIEINAEDKSKVYGDPDPSLTYNLNDSLKLNDSIIGELDRDSGQTAGNYTINQNNLTIDKENNYNIFYNSGNLEINPKYLEITAEDKNKTYGEDDPNLTYEITSGSLQYNDTFNGELDRESGESIGEYDINQNTLEPDNSDSYDQEYNKRTFEILKNNESCSLYFSEDSPLEYNTTFRVWTDCSSNYTLERNETEINNNSDQDLDKGLYNYTVTREDQENYSNTYDQELFEILKYNTSLEISIDPDRSQYYENDDIKIEGSNCPNDINCSLFKNGEERDNPHEFKALVDNYTFVYNTTGSNNYKSDSVNITIEVIPEKTHIFSVDFSETINIVLLVILFILPFVLIYFFGYYLMASLITIIIGFILLFNNFNIIIGLLTIAVGVYIAFSESDRLENLYINKEIE